LLHKLKFIDEFTSPVQSAIVQQLSNE